MLVFAAFALAVSLMPHPASAQADVATLRDAFHLTG